MLGRFLLFVPEIFEDKFVRREMPVATSSRVIDLPAHRLVASMSVPLRGLAWRSK